MMGPGYRAATPWGVPEQRGKIPGNVFKGKKLHFLQFFPDDIFNGE